MTPELLALAEHLARQHEARKGDPLQQYLERLADRLGRGELSADNVAHRLPATVEPRVRGGGHVGLERSGTPEREE